MLELLRYSCPLPTIDLDGGLHDGLSLPQSKKCMRCPTRSCRMQLANSEPTIPLHSVCEFGFSTVLVPTPFGTLLINGVVVPYLNLQLDAHSRKANRSRKVPFEKIQAYADALVKASPGMQKALEQRALEAVAGLHDIKTAVNLVYRQAEGIVRHIPGDSMDEKIEAAEPDLKSLLIAVRLLRSRLEMASIIANPESAQYGQPRPTPVYKIFHRIVRLFEEEAMARSVRIRMTGSSFNTPLLFDSFETIPLVLIDNAVKYSNRNTSLVVRVDDQPVGTCMVSVESEGDLIPPESRRSIFDQGFRTSQAKDVASSGSGLGLYIAKIVADANTLTIKYTGQPLTSSSNYGINTFTFLAQSTWKKNK
jgi:signal transduction histidine kinase